MADALEGGSRSKSACWMPVILPNFGVLLNAKQIAWVRSRTTRWIRFPISTTEDRLLAGQLLKLAPKFRTVQPTSFACETDEKLSLSWPARASDCLNAALCDQKRSPDFPIVRISYAHCSAHHVRSRNNALTLKPAVGRIAVH